jgi:hypothetical protein
MKIIEIRFSKKIFFGTYLKGDSEKTGIEPHFCISTPIIFK